MKQKKLTPKNTEIPNKITVVSDDTVYFSPQGKILHDKKIQEKERIILAYKSQNKITQNTPAQDYSQVNEIDGMDETTCGKLEIEVDKLKLASLKSKVITYPKVGEEITDVCIGSSVTTECDGKSINFHIVGFGETNLRNRELAYTAPIANAILGKPLGYNGPISVEGKSKIVKIVDVSPYLKGI